MFYYNALLHKDSEKKRLTIGLQKEILLTGWLARGFLSKVIT